MTWRERARPIIARVLTETAGRPEKEIRRALKEAFPWGPRAMHPYRAWLAEVREQRGRPAFRRSKSIGRDAAAEPVLELELP